MMPLTSTSKANAVVKQEGGSSVPVTCSTKPSAKKVSFEGTADGDRPHVSTAASAPIAVAKSSSLSTSGSDENNMVGAYSPESRKKRIER